MTERVSRENFERQVREQLEAEYHDRFQAELLSAQHQLQQQNPEENIQLQ
jgi:hypothetical protein